MSKFTFKKEKRETGLAGVGYPNPDTIIKLDKKPVGYIIAPNWRTGDNKWGMKFTVIDGSPSGWRWLTTKFRFTTEPEAREFILANSDMLLALNFHKMDD